MGLLGMETRDGESGKGVKVKLGFETPSGNLELAMGGFGMMDGDDGDGDKGHGAPPELERMLTGFGVQGQFRGLRGVAWGCGGSGVSWVRVDLGFGEGEKLKDEKGDGD